MTQLDQFLLRAEHVLNRLESLLPMATPAPDWQLGHAFRWRKRGGQGYLQVVRHASVIHWMICTTSHRKKRRLSKIRGSLYKGCQRITSC
jgi:predicted AAA+ superfamily ATPase